MTTPQILLMTTQILSSIRISSFMQTQVLMLGPLSIAASSDQSVRILDMSFCVFPLEVLVVPPCHVPSAGHLCHCCHLFLISLVFLCLMFSVVRSATRVSCKLRCCSTLLPFVTFCYFPPFWLEDLFLLITDWGDVLPCEIYWMNFVDLCFLFIAFFVCLYFGFY